MLKITNSKPVKNTDFKFIEDHFCCALPEGVRNFIKNYNGDITNGEYGVELEFSTFNEKSRLTDGFCKVLHTRDIIRQLSSIGYLEDFFECFALKRNEVEVETLLPIMEANGGGLNIYVSIGGAHVNKLFVVDNGDFGICKTDYTLNSMVS